jgi:hypothetical protein
MIFSCKSIDKGSNLKEFELSENFCEDVKLASVQRWESRYGEPLEYFAGFMRSELTSIDNCRREIKARLNGAPSTTQGQPGEIPAEDNASAGATYKEAGMIRGEGCAVSVNASEQQLQALLARLDKNFAIAQNPEACRMTITEFCALGPSNRKYICDAIDAKNAVVDAASGAANAAKQALSQRAQQAKEFFEANYIEPGKFLSENGIEGLCETVSILRRDNPQRQELGVEAVIRFCSGKQTAEEQYEAIGEMLYKAGVKLDDSRKQVQQKITDARNAIRNEAIRTTREIIAYAQRVKANLEGVYQSAKQQVTAYQKDLARELTPYFQTAASKSWTNNEGVATAVTDAQGNVSRECCECMQRFYWDDGWVRDTEDTSARKLWRSVAQKGSEAGGNCVNPGGYPAGHQFDSGTKWYGSKIRSYYYLYEGCRKVTVKGESCHTGLR